MSSNIQVQRICQYCGKEFTARTTVTKCCSDNCAKRAYKARLKTAKIEASNKETFQTKVKTIEELKVKEFLTAKEVAALLNISVRSVHYYIDNGTIKAVNLGQRMTRVKRSELDKLFEQSQLAMPAPEQRPVDISGCYNLTEIQIKYGISESSVHQLIKKHNISKIKKGWYSYVPKDTIDSLLNKPKA